MRHVVNFSGGAGSWLSGVRVAERFGRQNTTLLCADTGNEAEDWAPFVEAAAAQIGAELVVVREETYGDIWEQAFAKRLMPSYFHGWCTVERKIKPMERWREENCVPSETRVYFGYDWTEEHRLERSRKQLAKDGWGHVDAPLMWDPVLSKSQILGLLRDSGLPFPEAYERGIPHNNCQQTGCFKMGESGWRQLLRVNPEAYAYSEGREQEFIAMLLDGDPGRDVSRVGMIYRPDRGRHKSEVLTLRDLRERVEAQGDLFADSGDWGSCGCVTDL